MMTGACLDPNGRGFRIPGAGSCIGRNIIWIFMHLCDPALRPSGRHWTVCKYRSRVRTYWRCLLLYFIGRPPRYTTNFCYIRYLGHAGMATCFGKATWYWWNVWWQQLSHILVRNNSEVQNWVLKGCENVCGTDAGSVDREPPPMIWYTNRGPHQCPNNTVEHVPLPPSMGRKSGTWFCGKGMTEWYRIMFWGGSNGRF